MSDVDNTVIAALDAQIAELSANLEALRKARAVMAMAIGAKHIGDIVAKTNGNDAPTQTPLLSPVQNEGKANGSGTIVPGSIGSIAMEVLRQAGKPLTVKQLLASIHARGKPNISEATLVSTLCTYNANGRIKRTAPSTYALP